MSTPTNTNTLKSTLASTASNALQTASLISAGTTIAVASINSWLVELHNDDANYEGIKNSVTAQRNLFD